MCRLAGVRGGRGCAEPRARLARRGHRRGVPVGRYGRGERPRGHPGRRCAEALLSEVLRALHAALLTLSLLL